MKTWKNLAQKLLIIHNWMSLGSFFRAAHTTKNCISILKIRLRHPLSYLLCALDTRYWNTWCIYFTLMRNNIILNARLHFYFWLMNVPFLHTYYLYQNQNKTKEFSSIEKFSHLNAHVHFFSHIYKNEISWL